MVSQALEGVWPVMVTPFTDNGAIDYTALEALIGWYEEHGAVGLFAVCQSSEMFFLSLRERMELARFVKEKAHIPVVASGHVSYSMEEQLAELRQMAQTGVDAVILITNRLAREDEPSEVWMEHLQTILQGIPAEIPLGLYECPYPYKRLISSQELRFCAESGRFLFLKDTCCDLERIRERLAIVKGSPLKLFNANTATLLESLRDGAAGFSGVMANFHADLYAWLCRSWEQYPEEAEQIQAGLTMCSQIERQLYPANAKYSLGLDGIPMGTVCRVQNACKLNKLCQNEVKQLRLLSGWMRKRISLSV